MIPARPGLRLAWLPLLAACAAAAVVAFGQPPPVAARPGATPGASAAPAPATSSASGKRYFVADISWANNTYYTPSQAKGAAEFELDVATKTLRWVLTYQDLSSPPTKVTLHAPAQPGATGAAIVDLSPGGPKSPARGESTLSDAQIEYLLTGWSYALVTTRKYPQGEARGQLDRVRKATPAFQ